MRANGDSALTVRSEAFLGAPAGGALAGPSIDGFLAALLQARPPKRVWLAGSLRETWEARIRDAGSLCEVLTLEGRDVLNVLMDAAGACGPGEQIWLNLDRSPSLDRMDLLTVDAFLAFAATRAHAPLVVLLRDDAPSLPRTQRLSVDRHGIVLLLREYAGGAYALGNAGLLEDLARGGGTPLPSTFLKAGPRRRLLALDVDGVLIDPGRAFHDAVALALAELSPGIPWTDELFLAFKRAGGFNNDFRLAAGALALAEAGELEAIKGREGQGLPHLASRIAELEPRCQTVVQKHYARTRRLERSLVAREDLEGFPGDVAIFTGRPPDELLLAYQVMGFRLPAVCDSAPHLRKPRPEGLLQLADAFRSTEVVFVGDTLDDAAALRGARELCPGLAWTFAAVGPDRARIAGPEDLQAERLLDLLPRLRTGAPA